MATNNLHFEDRIERLGRILARQYGIEVIFEGNQACTDGKKIYLPQFENLSSELEADVNGFLDHEVAHCKFTDFDQIKECKTRFHKELLNAVEDTRIEKEIVKEFPGTSLNLDPLNEKYRGKMDAKWDKIPAPIRLIVGIRDLMEGKTPKRDEDIKEYLDAVEEKAKKLGELNSTKELRKATGEIAKLISKKREEKKEEEKEDGEKDDKGEPKKSDEKSESKSGEGGEGKSGEGTGEEKPESESDGEGKPEKPESESGEGSESKPEKSEGESSGEKFDKLIAEKAGEKEKGKSEFDKHVTDVHSLLDEEIREAIGDDKKPKRKGSFTTTREFDKTAHIAATTRFDKVTSYSGKGDARGYAALRREVKPLVGSIKRTLERTLKVRENAKWTSERERGVINSRSLSNLATNKSYRTPFKQFSKVETNNVAVQLLIDQSGSMDGNKIETAKVAAVAMAEALRELNISFEVTGFYSEYEQKSIAHLRGIDTKRFNRKHEALRLNIFKDFKDSKLTGIEKIYTGIQNPDGECVRWAAKRLAEQKQNRKILIVFSDGMPSTAEGSHRILNNDLKKSIFDIKRSGIEVIGIGIETDAVKTFYPEYVVIDRATDLPKKAMTKLSNILTRVRR